MQAVTHPSADLNAAQTFVLCDSEIGVHDIIAGCQTGIALYGHSLFEFFPSDTTEMTTEYLMIGIYCYI